jgi:hypothetical protein
MELADKIGLMKVLTDHYNSALTRHIGNILSASAASLTLTVALTPFLDNAGWRAYAWLFGMGFVFCFAIMQTGKLRFYAMLWHATVRMETSRNFGLVCALADLEDDAHRRVEQAWARGGFWIRFTNLWLWDWYLIYPILIGLWTMSLGLVYGMPIPQILSLCSLTAYGWIAVVALPSIVVVSFYGQNRRKLENDDRRHFHCPNSPAGQDKADYASKG